MYICAEKRVGGGEERGGAGVILQYCIANDFCGNWGGGKREVSLQNYGEKPALWPKVHFFTILRGHIYKIYRCYAIGVGAMSCLTGGIR